MSIYVSDIHWNKVFLTVTYTATEGEELLLYRVKTSTWVRFTTRTLSDGRIEGTVNITLGDNRQPLEAGDWIFCTRIPAAELQDMDAFLAKNPHIACRLERDSRRELAQQGHGEPGDDTPVDIEPGVEKLREHPYDTEFVEFAPELLTALADRCNVFKYSGKYAYVATLSAKESSSGHICVVLTTVYYIKNYRPEKRKGSKRDLQKRVFKAAFRLFQATARRSGKRVLFFKENGSAPTENMAAVRDRMIERGLDHEFQIAERYRNVFQGKQNIFGWLGDLREIARADYIFIDDYTPVFGFIRPDERTVVTQTWHAGVGFKSVGYARFGGKGSPDPIASAHRAYTYALVGNEHLRSIYSEVFGIEESALLATGMPRLDHFLDGNVAQDAVADLTARYPWMAQGRVITFAPTFRGTGQRTAHYPYNRYIDMAALFKMCEETNSYFVFEMHHFIQELPQIPAEYASRIFDLSHENLSSLYHVSDVLVTDYSSCFYDYLLLKKPVVFYMPDKLEYSVLRGVQRPIEEMAPGVICETFEDFVEVLGSRSYEQQEPNPLAIDRKVEGGMLACDRAIDTILLGRDVPGVRA